MAKHTWDHRPPTEVILLIIGTMILMSTLLIQVSRAKATSIPPSHRWDDRAKDAFQQYCERGVLNLTVRDVNDDYKGIAYPKKNQNRTLHTEDLDIDANSFQWSGNLDAIAFNVYVLSSGRELQSHAVAYYLVDTNRILPSNHTWNKNLDGQIVVNWVYINQTIVSYDGTINLVVQIQNIDNESHDVELEFIIYTEMADREDAVNYRIANIKIGGCKLLAHEKGVFPHPIPLGKVENDLKLPTHRPYILRARNSVKIDGEGVEFNVEQKNFLLLIPGVKGTVLGLHIEKAQRDPKHTYVWKNPKILNPGKTTLFILVEDEDATCEGNIFSHEILVRWLHVDLSSITLTGDQGKATLTFRLKYENGEIVGKGIRITIKIGECISEWRETDHLGYVSFNNIDLPDNTAEIRILTNEVEDPTHNFGGKNEGWITYTKETQGILLIKEKTTLAFSTNLLNDFINLGDSFKILISYRSEAGYINLDELIITITLMNPINGKTIATKSFNLERIRPAHMYTIRLK